MRTAPREAVGWLEFLRRELTGELGDRRGWLGVTTGPGAGAPTCCGDPQWRPVRFQGVVYVDPDLGERAARRAAEAAVRIAELQERRQRLVDGQPVTAEDLARARAAADRQVVRDVGAHLAAAETHLAAAELSVATGDLNQAAHHRARAADDVVAARTARHTKDSDGEPPSTTDA